MFICFTKVSGSLLSLGRGHRKLPRLPNTKKGAGKDWNFEFAIPCRTRPRNRDFKKIEMSVQSFA
jgi:hypothetical protein